MSDHGGFVVSIGKQLATYAKLAFERCLIAFWKRRDHVVITPQGLSTSLDKNVQSSMNLIMPLADPTADRSGPGRAGRVRVDRRAAHRPQRGGHRALRPLDIIDGNLCMFSTFDGDFTTYIRDFIVAVRQRVRRPDGRREGPAAAPVASCTPRRSSTGSTTTTRSRSPVT